MTTMTSRSRTSRSRTSRTGRAVAALDEDPARRIEGPDAFRGWMQDLSDRTVDALAGVHFDIPAEIREFADRGAQIDEGALVGLDIGEALALHHLRFEVRLRDIAAEDRERRPDAPATEDRSQLQDYIAPVPLIARSCSASGTKFHDLDADGVRDAGEPGLPGFRIWADYDHDGVRDAGEPVGEEIDASSTSTSKTSVSEMFIERTRTALSELMSRRLDDVRLAVMMLDGIELKGRCCVVALGIDTDGVKHPLGLWDGSTENATVATTLLANLVERGLDVEQGVLVVLDGAKALSRAVRDTFGGFALIQRCQVHKGRNIIERLDPSLHAGVKKVLRQAWDSPTAEQAERVLKNLARRLDHDAPGVSASILEGLDEMLTVIRLGLPDQLRRSLGCTNAIESLMAVLRQVCRNVKRWRDARMALRWTGTAMLEAEKSFRRLKAHKQLPILRAALLRHQQALLADQPIASKNLAA